MNRTTTLFAGSFLLMILLLSMTPRTGLAQRSLFSPSTLTIDATGEALVPADKIYFHINISTTGRTPGEVFEEHKRQEKYLADRIREFGLDESRLTFQPINIGSRVMREATSFSSNQQVRLELDDFSLYERMQVLLIENGFENFSGQFGSTKLEEGENEALEMAIANAQEKARRIASLLGKNLGEVRQVEHTEHRVLRSDLVQFSESRSADTGSLMEFDQMIPVTRSIRIIYRIQ